jgi:hypothetical protein
VFAKISYGRALTAFAEFQRSGYHQLEKTFMNEKILGMHFIYHTRTTIYDGWRPPVHEPLLIVGMWLNGNKDPLQVSLETRLRLYKQTFPNRPVKLNCSCAIMESSTYHQDPIWRLAGAIPLSKNNRNQSQAAQLTANSPPPKPVVLRLSNMPLKRQGHGIFTLKVFGPGADQLRGIVITDITGKAVYSSSVSTRQARLAQQVDLRHLVPGVYFAQVQISDYIKTKKLVIY